MDNTYTAHINECIKDSVSLINNTTEEKNINMMVTLDCFHTEIIQDKDNYALWYQNQINKISITTLDDKEQITEDDFINYYLGFMKTAPDGDQVLLRCLEIECNENSHLYSQKMLKIINDEYLFRYLKDFV